MFDHSDASYLFTNVIFYEFLCFKPTMTMNSDISFTILLSLKIIQIYLLFGTFKKYV